MHAANSFATSRGRTHKSLTNFLFCTSLKSSVPRSRVSWYNEMWSSHTVSTWDQEQVNTNFKHCMQSPFHNVVLLKGDDADNCPSVIPTRRLVLFAIQFKIVFASDKNFNLLVLIHRSNAANFDLVSQRWSRERFCSERVSELLQHFWKLVVLKVSYIFVSTVTASKYFSGAWKRRTSVHTFCRFALLAWLIRRFCMC